jgi:bromodomain adjacent to zinc finger domain protein 1A
MTMKTVIDLNIEEKLKILNCLMHQILQFGSIRDSINERNEKLKQAKNDLRSVQLAEKKRETEELLKYVLNFLMPCCRTKLLTNFRNRMEKQKLKEGEAEAAAAEATAAPVDNEKLEAEKARREKENSKKHADFLAKELKALDQVHSLEWGVAAVYLGSDRAHRRYWLFQSLNGIFIENDIENVNSYT